MGIGKASASLWNIDEAFGKTFTILDIFYFSTKQVIVRCTHFCTQNVTADQMHVS